MKYSTALCQHLMALYRYHQSNVCMYGRLSVLTQSAADITVIMNRSVSNLAWTCRCIPELRTTKEVHINPFGSLKRQNNCGFCPITWTNPCTDWCEIWMSTLPPLNFQPIWCTNVWFWPPKPLPYSSPGITLDTTSSMLFSYVHEFGNFIS